MRTVLITGGAGFIGVNAAHHFFGQGWDIVLFDNLSRKGVLENLKWAERELSAKFVHGDVRDAEKVEHTVVRLQPALILHLAAQVSVGVSIQSPREDFETNAAGTLNVLEAVRRQSPQTFVIFASSNKIYGKMDDVPIAELSSRYEYRDLPKGVGEDRHLDCHSPYGCSKGAADQYIIDYARVYGLGTASFRQSCVYGPRQLGQEEQGWVAWFVIAAVLGKGVTVFGDGKQVRDLLHVTDLVSAYELAYRRRDKVAGQAINIGGGSTNTLSLMELITMLENALGTSMQVAWGAPRTGDQRVYVSSLAKAEALLDWHPQVSVDIGVHQLIQWVQLNRHLFQPLL